jgi:hypothetical protein
VAQQQAEAERLAAEAAEAIAADEAARVAAEREAELRRQAAAELARLTAEEQARQSVEAQAQVAAEQEAARQAAERAAADRTPVEAGPSDHDVATGAARAAQAASMLTELNRVMPVQAGAAPVDGPPAEAAAPAPVAEVHDPADDPAPMVARDHTDTAMLLRELSSLGFGADDERPAGPSSAPPPRPVQQSPDKKKRKGLFGRG